MSALAEVRAAVNDAQQLQASWNELALNQALDRAQQALDVLELQYRRAAVSKPSTVDEQVQRAIFQALALLESALRTASYRDGLSTEMVVGAEPLGRVVELLKTASSG